MGIHVSERVRRIKPSPSTSAADRANALRREGRSIVNLVVGEPDRRAPQPAAALDPDLLMAVDEHLLDIGCEVALASLGDYVLNGGEVAVLAITEAVVRLVPGVVGNAASLVEESHSEGLLEYPLYTRPASWTDPAGVLREAPQILLSGDHGKIAAWRREQSVQRTGARRPDLLEGPQTPR